MLWRMRDPLRLCSCMGTGAISCISCGHFFGLCIICEVGIHAALLCIVIIWMDVH
jgi:hypothetical protein